MTPLNTIIEEEKKELGEIKRLIVEKDPDDDDKFLRQIWELASQIEESRTTAMQRAYEAGREERDTYWKEREKEAYKKGYAECEKEYGVGEEYDLGENY